MNLQDFFVLGALLLTFGSSSNAEIIDRVEAIINKKAVFKSDVDHFRELIPLRAKIDPLFANEPLSKKHSPSESDIVNFLVDEALIAAKFPANDAEVEQEINSIQANLKIDRDGLKAAINREGFKFDDYFKLMRISLAKRQLIDREIRNKSVVSEDDVRAEYNRNRAGSKSFRGSFHIFLMEFKKKDFKSSALAKEEAQKALDAVKGGAAFGGEDLGYLAYSEMTEGLQKEVQKMGPEKMSGIVEEADRFLIAKTGDIKAEVDPAFDREKDVLKGRLMDAEFQHQVRLWLDRERAQNFVKVNVKAE